MMNYMTNHKKPFGTVILFAILLFCSCASEKNSNEDNADADYFFQDDAVYICTGRFARTYHSNPNCSGLNLCSAEIDAVPVEKAKKMGRRKCKKCY